MKKIRRLTKGDQVSAADWNELADRVEKFERLGVGNGLTLSNGPSGMKLGIAPSRVPPGGVYFRNDSGFEVPPWGVMAPIRYNTTDLPSNPFYQTTRPMDLPDEVLWPQRYLVNKDDAVANGGFGYGHWAFDQPVKCAFFVSGFDTHFFGADPYKDSFLLTSGPSWPTGVGASDSLYGNFYNQGYAFRQAGGGIEGTSSTWYAGGEHPTYIVDEPDGTTGPLRYRWCMQEHEPQVLSNCYTMKKGSDSLGNGGLWPINLNASAWLGATSREYDTTRRPGSLPPEGVVGSTQGTLHFTRRGYYRFDLQVCLRLYTTTPLLDTGMSPLGLLEMSPNAIKTGTPIDGSVASHRHYVPNPGIAHTVSIEFMRGPLNGMTSRATIYREDFSWLASRTFTRNLSFDSYMGDGERAGFRVHLNSLSGASQDPNTRLDLTTGGSYPEYSLNNIRTTRLREVIKIG